MARNGKRQLLFFGPPEAIRGVQSKADERFGEEGYSINWEATYPVVEHTDVQAALDGEDQKSKSAEWIRDIRPSALRGVIQSANEDEPAIGGWGITLKPREISQWSDVADQLIAHSTLQYNITSSSPQKRPPGQSQDTTSSNAPFSYSPTDDYATEPDR